jgi:hypothetical protein
MKFESDIKEIRTAINGLKNKDGFDEIENWIKILKQDLDKLKLECGERLFNHVKKQYEDLVNYWNFVKES